MEFEQEIVSLDMNWCPVGIYISGATAEEVEAYLALLGETKNFGSAIQYEIPGDHTGLIDFFFPEDRLKFAIIMRDKDDSKIKRTD